MPELSALASRLLNVASWLTSPLTPDDSLGLIDSLLGARFPVGRVTEVWPETPGAVTLAVRPGREDGLPTITVRPALGRASSVPNSTRPGGRWPGWTRFSSSASRRGW
ncbi:hypothetical protein GCM10010252_26160 [Streptomyces aureoverticillatus]|nr:hypothetical protein GCM10010252_26160 [Streptomyces aureoverticillatus]